jgi:Zn-dependent protease
VFGRSWRLGRIGGIPISVDTSLLWAAALFTYVLWVRFSSVPALASWAAIALAAFAVALFFGSVLVHELAHAAASRALRIPVEGVMLFFLGGATTARTEDRGPGAEFLVSAAGPAASLALGGTFWWLADLVRNVNVPVAAAIGRVGWINVVIAAFNALPAFPLDGGRMLRAAIWKVGRNRRLATRVAAGGGIVLAGLLTAGGLWRASNGDLGGAVWLFVIATFIYQAARAANRELAVRDVLVRGVVADAMGPPPTSIPGDLSLTETLDRYLRGHEDESFPVVEDGRVLGMLTFDSARRIGRDEPTRPARDAVIPIEDLLVVAPGDRLDVVAERVGPGRAALVLRDGHLVGAIGGHDIGRWAAAPSGPTTSGASGAAPAP